MVGSFGKPQAPGVAVTQCTMRFHPSPLLESGEPWQREAACRGEAELFAEPPVAEPMVVQLRREEAAKAVCARCPVLLECRAYALRTQQRTGIWGGLTARERSAVRAREARRQRLLVTDNGSRRDRKLSA